MEQSQSAEEIIAQGFDEADRAPRAAAGAHGGVQAQAGGAGVEGDLARVRHRLAHADRAAGIAAPYRAAAASAIRFAATYSSYSR